MKRSEFLSSAALLACMPGIAVAASPSRLPPAITKPKQLCHGGTIGLAAPAGVINEAELQESVENIAKLGFKAKTNPGSLNRNGYFAGTDKERAAMLMELFTDPEVDAIMCVRGGYGAARILPYLDFAAIRSNPKILIGYSDITALHAALYQQAGLVSFHGPVGTSTFNEYSIDNFTRVLIKPEQTALFYKSLTDGDKPENQLTTIRTGTAAGTLFGGNLSIVASLIGTPYDVSYQGGIVYLEEVGEEPYRVDRMLTQMIQAGKFNGVRGVALGIFKNCQSKEKESGINNSFSLMEVLTDRLYPLGIPVVYGLSFGHVENKLTLPFGIRAEIDSGAGTLTLLETAVQ